MCGKEAIVLRCLKCKDELYQKLLVNIVEKDILDCMNKIEVSTITI
ncbi:hypothetical protein [uncultured Holdemanella sp.]|nr:hypothetical protein [uncultured Holdemanella sp.]